MISSKSVRAGVVIEIMAAGSGGRFEIVDVCDGRVTLKQYGRRPKGRSNKKGRWWLDYAYVRENAKLAARDQS